MVTVLDDESRPHTRGKGIIIQNTHCVNPLKNIKDPEEKKEAVKNAHFKYLCSKGKSETEAEEESKNPSEKGKRL